MTTVLTDHAALLNNLRRFIKLAFDKSTARKSGEEFALAPIIE